jgi:putative transposase
VLEDVEAWQKRHLEKRYSVLYMDGVYVALKRDTVETECIYVVMGITERQRQILGYYIGGHESATSCLQIFLDLRSEELKKFPLVLQMDLQGQKKRFQIFPKADFQRCVVHKLRNILAKVRAKDKPKVLEDLKGVYSSPTKGRHWLVSESLSRHGTPNIRQRYSRSEMT